MSYHDDDTQKDMKAVEEPLSPLAQLRIDLKTYENARAELYNGNKNWEPANRVLQERFSNAKYSVEVNFSAKLHMLFDALDAKDAEIARLNKELAISDKKVRDAFRSGSYHWDGS